VHGEPPEEMPELGESSHFDKIEKTTRNEETHKRLIQQFNLMAAGSLVLGLETGPLLQAEQNLVPFIPCCGADGVPIPDGARTSHS
jgi:hypothetical protein